MIRPELHYVPRPFMDSTAYKQAVREVYEVAAPEKAAPSERRATRRGPPKADGRRAVAA
ncbi:MAG: hypothetical protein NVSMB26_05280 [Beijerinckiaceae bacterium]